MLHLSHLMQGSLYFPIKVTKAKVTYGNTFLGTKLTLPLIEEGVLHHSQFVREEDILAPP